jgi:hypothetical protein
MKIAYLYDLPSKTADAWKCDKVFVDLPAMNRVHRKSLIDDDGISHGDVLVICKLSQLGQGRESSVMQQRIAKLGATIEVVPLPAPVKLKPRTGWLVPTPEQKNEFCPLWHSTDRASYVLATASNTMGQPVNISWLNRHCGNRFKK